jgi:hypothetical protein
LDDVCCSVLFNCKPPIVAWIIFRRNIWGKWAEFRVARCYLLKMGTVFSYISAYQDSHVLAITVSMM